jgi:hypothetical protein
MKFPPRFGDHAAFAIGILLTLLLLAFFGWKLADNLSRDHALGPVPASTPTPPPPSPLRSKG